MRRRSDLPLVLFLLFALGLQVLWLFTHLGVLHWPWQKTLSLNDADKAGIISHITKDLKRRDSESLLWEMAEVNQPLFYHDSILTLSQSQATLLLEKKTEIHLSENTLVTIEHLDDHDDDQIRLRFVKGNLVASSPQGNTRIEAPHFSLDMKQGAEIQLRQTDSQQFEVEVIKGDAQIQKADKVQNLSQNQILKLNDNEVLQEKIAVSDSMKFSESIPERIYTHQETAHFGLQWQGEASQIKAFSVDGEQKNINVNPSQNRAEIELPLGSYNLRLENEGVLSKSFSVSVWRAPEIHLLAPTPRSRVITNTDLEFVWTEIPQAVAYRLEIRNKNTGTLYKISAKSNAVDAKLTEAGEFEWQVIGIDELGFEIPKLNTQTLFAAASLLAAPRLKDPRVRLQQNERQPANEDQKKPKSKKPGASFWNLLIRPAYAEDLDSNPIEKPSLEFEAVFEWEKVAGANRYVIEISESPDFLDLKLTKKVRNPRYIWNGFKPGTYYWRVAASSENGEVGQFSEPARFNATELTDAEFVNEGVVIRRKPEPKLERSVIETKTEAVMNEAPKPLFEEKRFEAPVEMNSEKREIKNSYLITFGSGTTQWNLNGNDSLKAKLTGTQPGLLHLQTEQKWSDQKSYLVDLNYSNIKWEPTSPLTYPFQNTQSFNDFQAKVLMGSNQDSWSYGISLENNPVIKRVDLEKVELQPTVSVGPSFLVHREASNHRFLHSAGLGAGNGLFSISTVHEYRYVFLGFGINLSLGVHLDGRLLFVERNTSTTWGAGLIFGIENE